MYTWDNGDAIEINVGDTLYHLKHKLFGKVRRVENDDYSVYVEPEYTEVENSNKELSSGLTTKFWYVGNVVPIPIDTPNHRLVIRILYE